MAFDVFRGSREGTGSGGSEGDGRRYVIDGAGFKSYPFDMQPPAIKAQHTRGQGASFTREDWEWDIYKGVWYRPVNTKNIQGVASLAMPLGLYGMEAAFGGFGSPYAATSAAGGTTPATVAGVEGSATGIGAGGVPGLASEGVPAIAGVTPTVLPSRQTVPNNTRGLPTGGAGLTGAEAVTEAVTKNKTADIVKKILAALVGAGGAAAAGGAFGGGGNTAPTTSPELQQMLAIAMRRMAAQEPLFDAVNRQAYGGLPAYVKQPGGPA